MSKLFLIVESDSGVSIPSPDGFQDALSKKQRRPQEEERRRKEQGAAVSLNKFIIIHRVLTLFSAYVSEHVLY